MAVRRYTVYWDDQGADPGWVLRTQHLPDADGYAQRDEEPLDIEYHHEDVLDAAEERIIAHGDDAPLCWDATSDGAYVAASRMDIGSDFVGVTEAARIAGVTPSAISKAHKRGRMPDPVSVAGSDALVWRRDVIEAWAEGRKTS